MRNPLTDSAIEGVRNGARWLRRAAVGLAALACLTTTATQAKAYEPWSDADPPQKPKRLQVGDYGFSGLANYRANWLYVNPISINTENHRRASWIEHRLRAGGTMDFKEKVKIVTSFEILDGVMWGDNGALGQDPEPEVGINVGARYPNIARPCIQQRGSLALDRNSYGYGLCSQESIFTRRLYGEAKLPFGLLRIGRQPVAIGQALQAVAADGRPNRFGFARRGNQVDRILFGTKPLEGFKPKGQRDLSLDRGLFVAVGYDRLVSDEVRLFGDDVQQAIFAVRFLDPDVGWAKDLELMGFAAYRWDQVNDSNILGTGVRAIARFGDLSLGGEWQMNTGGTREISAAYALISNDPVVKQTVRQMGARAVARYDRPMWSAYVEFDYASGDGDPQPGTPLTQFRWAEGNNVGLLMFEHVLNFQSARSAAAGVETLRRLGAQSFPAETIDTRGSFTNAIAVFPQFDVRPHKNVLFRTGVLAAWSDEPVNDPVRSLLSRDGLTIQDDLVNFAGGKSQQYGSYYGTEIDGRFQWRYLEHFIFDLEGAILFPGDALKDKNGYGVRSVLVQGRTTFTF